ncbi:MAG: hypothetical protein E7261_10190 [Lachnospiraceae bacterium]|nr:hypothetical protein [Lachnospiraceae bacterium]
MSNTIAHLAVAKELWTKKPDLVQNKRAYYLGILAPDTITAKPDAVREDKKRVHLRENIRDAEWLEPDQMAIFTDRVREFIQKYISNESDLAQRDFNIGYLVHLLTDKCNHGTIRQKLLKKANERGLVSSDREFYHMCVNDLEALDAYLLERYPEIDELFAELRSEAADFGLPGWIEKDYINGSMWWWTNKYLPGIKEREILYINTEDIEEFIAFAVKEIMEELEVLLK